MVMKTSTRSGAISSERETGDETQALGSFHSVANIAFRLKVSERSVHRWIKTGILSAHHFGRSVRISERDLVSFLARNRNK